MLIKRLFAAATALVIAGALSFSPAKATSTPTSVIAGMEYSVCAIVANGTIECWGRNTDGQLGGGSNSQEPVPVNYIAGSWQYLMNGGAGNHMCAIKSDGTLWCWGRNTDGQLGNNSSTNAPTPVQVGNDSTWVAGAVGFNSTCAIKSDGTLWCWGANSHGKLGNGSTDASLVPVQSSLTGVATVTVADEHACALKSDNTIWCWGHGTTGELGDGNATDATSPVQVTGSWKAVTAGQTNPEPDNFEGHTCALKSDNTLWCWGTSLGGGAASTSNVPVEIPGGGTWASVTTGPWATCAIKSSDASLWCWGDEYNGHLGNGITGGYETTPQAVTGSHAWLTSVQTHDSMCGVQTDLSLWCWGAQTDGVIGVAGVPEVNPNPLALNRTVLGDLPPTDRDGGNVNGVLLLLAGALAAAGVGLSVRKDALAQ